MIERLYIALEIRTCPVPASGRIVADIDNRLAARFCGRDDATGIAAPSDIICSWPDVQSISEVEVRQPGAADVHRAGALAANDRVLRRPGGDVAQQPVVPAGRGVNGTCFGATHLIVLLCQRAGTYGGHDGRVVQSNG